MTVWTTYKVDTAVKDGRTPFTSVGHTTHVESALEIVRQGEVRPGLVFDKSILNDRRILVSWVSPNDWGNLGYRYGNIRFDFDFAALIDGKRSYWVEAITSYSPHAPRILITDQDRDAELAPYDPSKDEGPWLYDKASNQHYFNGKYTLEFMYEGPISLQHLTFMNFVRHSPKYCSVLRDNPTACEYLGSDGSLGGARFFARCAAAGISLVPYASHFITPKNGNPNHILSFAYRPIAFLLNKKAQPYTGSVAASDALADVLAAAILGAFSYGHIAQVKELAALFKNVEECETAVAKAFGAVIALKTWPELIEEP